MTVVSFRGEERGCDWAGAHRYFGSSDNVIFLDVCGSFLYNNLLSCIFTFCAFSVFFSPLSKNVFEPGDNIRISLRVYCKNEMKPCRALRICLALCETLINVNYPNTIKV